MSFLYSVNPSRTWPPSWQSYWRHSNPYPKSISGDHLPFPPCAIFQSHYLPNTKISVWCSSFATTLFFHRLGSIERMALTNFILTVVGVSAVVLLMRSDVKQSASIFKRNVRQIRHWLEEESASAAKYSFNTHKLFLDLLTHVLYFLYKPKLLMCCRTYVILHPFLD